MAGLLYSQAVQPVQIFGVRRCADTRKAERWFKERRVPLQLVDLSEKGLSAGELRSVAARAGGLEALADTTGKRWTERGLRYASRAAAELERLLLEDPLLLRTPIVRQGGQRATVGYAPDVWASWQGD